MSGSASSYQGKVAPGWPVTNSHGCSRSLEKTTALAFDRGVFRSVRIDSTCLKRKSRLPSLPNDNICDASIEHIPPGSEPVLLTDDKRDGEFEEDKDRLPLLLVPSIPIDAHTGTEPQVQLFEAVEKDIDKLEDALSRYEEDNHVSGTETFSLWEIEVKMDRLKQEVCQMQAELDSKEKSLNVALHEAQGLQNKLRDAQNQVSSLTILKEGLDAKKTEEALEMDTSFKSFLQILDEHLLTTEAVNSTQASVWRFEETIHNLHVSSVDQQIIKVLEKEAHLSYVALLAVTQALAKAEGEVSMLAQELVNADKALEKEKEASQKTREWVKKLEETLEVEEAQVANLFEEVSSLKAQLDEKEKVLQELSGVAIQNRELLETKKKTHDALHQSNKKVEQLVAQCHLLEGQIESRDLLLKEIEEETLKSTEALRFAAQIKQDLNMSRQKELELLQELEKQKSIVMELRQELNENHRAMKAEAGLRQAEKSARDLAAEVKILKKGIESRDEVIKLMQDELDTNIHVLNSAAENRETMQKMQVYIENMESKLKDLNLLYSKADLNGGKNQGEHSFKE